MKPHTAFRSDQNSQAYPDGIEHNFWHIARNRILLHYFGRHRREPLLEIGAGRGIVLAGLRKAGWEAYGVDLTIVDPCEPGLPIRYGQDAFTLPETERIAYRSVALLDVLEHLTQRVEFLQRLRIAFPFIERLYITVPASPVLWSNYDEFYGHCLRYTQDILRYELESAGYQVLFMRYFFHSLWWAIRIQLILNKKRPEQFTPPTGIKQLAHRVLGHAFYWEGRLLPGSWRGSSLLAIAKPVDQ